MKCIGEYEWLSPTFIVPNKIGRARCVSYFIDLNKYIILKCISLSKTENILKKQTEDKSFTKLDVPIKYYTFEVYNETLELYIVNTNFGL